MCNLLYCEGLGAFVPVRYMYVHGAIIGEVDIIDCRHYPPGDLPRLLANPVEYKEPIPCKGMLKFFTPKFEPEKRGNDEQDRNTLGP